MSTYKNPAQCHYGFIGLGLIGGTVARGLRKVYPQCRISAYDIAPATLTEALNDGVINTALDRPDNRLSDCDVIFLCAPVSVNSDYVKEMKTYLKEDAILSDVGSVKMPIYREIHSLEMDDCFVGGHPMAGSERIGYSNSRPALLENAYYILTPSHTVSEAKVTFMQELVKSIGAIPLVMGCDKHDFATAGISHLPHVISAALVNFVKDQDDTDETMRLIAAGGFKDITRISSSSPVMWENICVDNQSNILHLLEEYIVSLQKIKETLEGAGRSEIQSFFESAKNYRESFSDASKGPIKGVPVFTVDIQDEPGGIATIATLLAFHQVNIKNIGITHNRELAEGALQIELAREEDLAKSFDILTAKGYKVYIKK